jgi:UDP-glucose 4-epimerase
VSGALVTGGAGFIGSHVSAALVGRGDDVLVVDDLSTGHEANVPAGAELAVVDILDGPGLEAVVERWRPTCIYHLAAQMDVRRSVREPAFDASVNVVGTVNVLLAAERAGVRRVVNTSTGGALYGPDAVVPTPESAEKAPLSPYGVSKMAAEGYIGWFHRSRRLSGVTLRYGNVYGPRQDPAGEAGVVAIFGRALQRDEPLAVFGDGHQTRDFIYVADVVEANLLAGAADVGGAFNIGTGRTATVLDILDGLVAQRGAGPAEVRWMPRREGEVERSCLATDRARLELGFVAGVEVANGLARTWEWLEGVSR